MLQQLSAQVAHEMKVERDPSALLLLRQVQAASGGEVLLRTVRDCIETGRITFFEASEEIEGSVTIRGRQPDQFRMDSTLASGVRSFAVSSRDGWGREDRGQRKRATLEQVANFVNFSVPVLQIEDILDDGTISVSRLGTEMVSGKAVQVIHTQRTFPFGRDRFGMLAQSSHIDFYIDAAMNIVRARNMIPADHDPKRLHPHDIDFADYRRVGGILVPFALTEFGDGRRTFSIQLESAQFNAGVEDLSVEK
jgi:hypothetical protein